MKFRVQLVIQDDNGAPEVIQEMSEWQRGALRAEELGLTLTEAKELLRGLQQAMVAEQTVAFAEEQTHCPSCGKHRARKGQHEIVFRTVFGKVNLQSPRYYRNIRATMTGKYF
jgi:hypothetical protein